MKNIIAELERRFETSDSIVLDMKCNHDKIAITKNGSQYAAKGGILLGNNEKTMGIEELAEFLKTYSENAYYTQLATDFEAEQQMYDFCGPSDEELMSMHG